MMRGSPKFKILKRDWAAIYPTPERGIPGSISAKIPPYILVHFPRVVLLTGPVTGKEPITCRRPVTGI